MANVRSKKMWKTILNSKFNQNFSPFIWNFSLILKNTPNHCQELNRKRQEKRNQHAQPDSICKRKSKMATNGVRAFSLLTLKFSSRTKQMTISVWIVWISYYFWPSKEVRAFIWLHSNDDYFFFTLSLLFLSHPRPRLYMCRLHNTVLRIPLMSTSWTLRWQKERKKRVRLKHVRMVFHTIPNIQLKFISFHRSQWTWDLYWWLWSHRST